MKQNLIIVLTALAVVNANDLGRKRVLRWRNPAEVADGGKLDEFNALFDAEGAAAEAMEVFGRYVGALRQFKPLRNSMAPCLPSVLFRDRLI
mmetsp:Transcript_31350/g.63722  ORF Transcript_31350/g.63722 Transcript_31350/m.63722 type:complete len:92 (-) Transcript_31350:4229-4504(-)